MAYRKAASELRLKTSGKVAYKICAILRPVLPLLFLDHDALTEFPVHHHALNVHATDGGVSRLRDDGADIGNEFIG
jgi:hypothetical protein